ncbi:hypothetical protein [Sphaerisporangium sp. NPDC051011]|uniref:hypothetical protein n=1 Tax=Sphaerisporangium sp. NPDC051011 TaxID=3155792 RepID=UPI0033E7AF93
MNFLDALPTDIRTRLIPETFAPLLAEATALYEKVPLGMIIQYIEFGFTGFGDFVPGSPAWEAEIREMAGRVAESDPADFDEFI